MRIWLTSSFDLQLLHGLVDIINGTARGCSPCVRAPPSLAPDERMLWERSTYEGGVRWMHENVSSWGKNSVVKGLRF